MSNQAEVRIGDLDNTHEYQQVLPTPIIANLLQE
jgi:hypothetical protein